MKMDEGIDKQKMEVVTNGSMMKKIPIMMGMVPDGNNGMSGQQGGISAKETDMRDRRLITPFQTQEMKYQGSYQHLVPGLEGWNDVPAAMTRKNVCVDGEEYKVGEATSIENEATYVWEAADKLLNKCEEKIIKRGEDKKIQDEQVNLLKMTKVKIDLMKEKVEKQGVERGVMRKTVEILQNLERKEYKNAETMSAELARDQINHGESWVMSLKWLSCLMQKLEG